MPNIPAELADRDQIRAGAIGCRASWSSFVQTTHPATIALEGDTATGRAYIHELARARDGRQGLYCVIYHDRYQRTCWRAGTWESRSCRENLRTCRRLRGVTGSPVAPGPHLRLGEELGWRYWLGGCGVYCRARRDFPLL
jgi:SnoaL-like domain